MLLYSFRDGDISAAPFSGNLSAGIMKPATQTNRWYDYDFAAIITGRVASDRRHTGYFNQLYAHLRLYIIDITAGVTPLVYGAQDPQLSSGGLLFSGNAHPVPRITIGIDKYTPFPGLYGYLHIRGGITHAWLNDHADVSKAMLHHKFIGVKIGNPWPVGLSYEFHHAAQWGGYSPYHGDLGNNLHAFANVFLAKAGGSLLTDQLNAYGNHIGVQQLALHFHHKEFYAELYWQSIFEDRSAAFIGTGMNRADGLWGINFKQKRWPFINNFTYEFLNTTSQSGPFHDKDGIVYAGRDGYYNNSVYTQGWTYFGQVTGNPFIQPQNNRVRLHYAGIGGDISGFIYTLSAAYVRNFGTYRSPQHSHNTSLLLQVSKTVAKAWNLDFSLALAADIGNQYGNRFGAMLSIRKRGLIKAY